MNYSHFKGALIVVFALLLLNACERTTMEQPGLELQRLATVNSVDQIGDSIQYFTEIVDATTERKRLQLGYPMSNFEPTGFYALPNTLLKVHLEVTKGSHLPTILVGTYSRTTKQWDPQSFGLKTGDNMLSVGSTGGIIWVRYENSNPDSEAKLTFTAGHLKHPTFIRDKTTNSDWNTQLQTYNVPDALFLGKRSLMVCDRTRAAATYNQDNNAVIITADRISETYDHLHGLDGSSPLHMPSANQRALFVESDKDEGLWMSAVDYRTTYHKNAAQFAFTPLILKKDGWGPWHEIGHMYQQQTWKWSSLGETTVNVYSLAAERAFGIPLKERRLVRDDVYIRTVVPFLAQADSVRNFENAGDWGKLYMFHQLWLAFGDDFYIKLHRQSREHSVQAGNMNDLERQRFLMVKACTISGYDLTTFFKKWGLNYDKSIYSEIAGLGLPKPPKDYSLLHD